MAIEVISTLKPKNNGDFPIAEAKDITVDENGTRLNTKLEELANSSSSGGSADNGFNLAKINMTSDSGGTIEMLIGTFENAMTNPASLVLVLNDGLFFAYKGFNVELPAIIYECPLIMSSGQATGICTLSTDGTCTLEMVEGSSTESSSDGFIFATVLNFTLEAYIGMIGGNTPLETTLNFTNGSISELIENPARGILIIPKCEGFITNPIPMTYQSLTNEMECVYQGVCGDMRLITTVGSDGSCTVMCELIPTYTSEAAIIWKKQFEVTTDGTYTEQTMSFSGSVSNVIASHNPGMAYIKNLDNGHIFEAFEGEDGNTRCYVTNMDSTKILATAKFESNTIYLSNVTVEMSTIASLLTGRLVLFTGTLKPTT